MEIISFIQVLIDNYDGSSEMKSNIMQKEITIYSCNDTKTINNVTQYYKDYSIIEETSINFLQIKSITEHTVNSLLHLKGKRIASCSDDCTIRIYNPVNNYHCDGVIKRHTKRISSICQLDNEIIVSGSYDNSIQIGSFKIKNAHNNPICKVIPLFPMIE